MFSTCGKCGGHSFKIQLQEPAGSRFKLNFVQCTSCSTPVGVLEYFNTSAQLEEQKKEIAALSSRLSQIEQLLRRVSNAVERR